MSLEIGTSHAAAMQVAQKPSAYVVLRGPLAAFDLIRKIKAISCRKMWAEAYGSVDPKVMED